MATDGRLAIGMVLLLGACTVGPEFERPSPWSPASWFRSTTAPEPTLASLR